jgi:hypothetical protein
MKRLLPFVLFFFTTVAHAQLGPMNPPPGAVDFRSMHRRAEWVRTSVQKLVPDADGACIYAVALELVGILEANWSTDVKERGKSPRTVRKGQEQAFLKSLRENAESECGGSGPGGKYATVRGLLEFASEQEEWDKANFEATKRDVLRAAEGLLRLGVFAPAASAAVAGGVVANASALITLDPSVFTNPTRTPPDGT